MSTADSKGNLHAGEGKPGGGRFIPKQRKEADPIDLTAGYVAPPSTPTPEQIEKATTGVLRAVTLQTGGAVTADEVEAHTPVINEAATDVMEMEACFNAWQEGHPHEDDEAFAAIWEGPGGDGYNRKMVEDNLAHHTSLQTGLRDGTIRPNKIIGSGYRSHVARDEAERYLEDNISTWQLALDSGGRNLSVNQRNVRGRKLAGNQAAA